MNTILTTCAWLLAVLLAAGAGAPARAGTPTLTERGAYLARLGDCVACHTAPKGQPFAGGLPMKTPMGVLYSTNISPDPVTGIGRWTLKDFEGALRRGVARDGHQLYPAMPYPSYAKIRDDDVAALYAYFMRAVAPVQRANRAPEMGFPFNLRAPLAMWNMAFLDRTVYQDKPAKSAEWNRGAYLVQGLGHCGACHTARGVGFQEKALDDSGAAYLAGAELDGWFASNLTREHNAGLGRWSGADLRAFLQTGANRHATAFGPMTEVVNNSTQFLSDADAVAIAAYLGTLAPQGATGRTPYVAQTPTAPAPAGSATVPGARVYRTYCAQCHGAGGEGRAPWLAPLAGNPNVLAARPASLLNVVLNGTPALVVGGQPAPYPMPGFARVLSDREAADVVSFIRSAWHNDAPAVAIKDVAPLRQANRVTH